METVVLVILLCVIALIIIIYGTIRNKRIREYEIKQIAEGYGQECKRNYGEGEYAHIQGYYRVHSDASEDCYHVDDITWNDLNMDDVYKSMNYSLSSAGDEYLYYLLRNPRPDACDHNRLNELADHYMNNPDIRLDMSIKLHDAGRTGKYSIYDYINNLDTLGSKSAIKDYALLAVYLVSIILLIFISRGIGALLLAVSMLYGGVSYFTRKSEIEPYVVSFSYILRLLKSTSAIAGSNDEFLKPEKDALKEGAANMSAFNRMSGLIMNKSTGSGDPIELVMDYIRMFTHVDIIKFFHMRDEADRHREDIDRLLTVTGFIDAAVSIGSYRTYLRRYCIPKKTESGIKATGIYHPLISDPVANDIVFNRGILLTGSNASGKSTMLRTVTLAAIMAQSIVTVAADSYEAPTFRVYTSLALNDSILKGESYYMTEIRSLKRIIDAGKSGATQILACVDEVLRGTNTVERISASAVIMKQLSEVNGIIMAATHDLELTELLKDYYDNYHFEEIIENDDIRFEYRLMTGSATTRNAIKLLDIMGYDKTLVKQAEEMALNYMTIGEYRL
ncbi:MAG: hypothetical protein K5868_04025 [Lachnospiraceae bacterium]|nr:hypothetical protein [Lachnospiraceae bacterium]